MGKIKDIDERFKKFGTVSFTAITKINDFIDHLENDQLMGTRCSDCNAVFFPPRADCCQCLSSNMQWFEIKGNGKLVSYSTLKFAPMGFDEDLPYSIALLDYGEFKVFGRLATDIAKEDIHIGMQLQAKVNQLPNGQLNYIFQRP